MVHSYGGWPGSGALEQIGDRVSSIVWVDAFKPENGQRGVDFSSEFSRKALEAAVAKGEPGRPAPPASAFHVNEKDRAWVDFKTTQQPNGVALQPIKLDRRARQGGEEDLHPRAEISAAGFDKAYAECKADKTWQTFETTTAGHDIMVDDPQWLTEILLKVS